PAPATSTPAADSAPIRIDRRRLRRTRPGPLADAPAPGPSPRPAGPGPSGAVPAVSLMTGPPSLACAGGARTPRRGAPPTASWRAASEAPPYVPCRAVATTMTRPDGPARAELRRTGDGARRTGEAPVCGVWAGAGPRGRRRPWMAARPGGWARGVVGRRWVCRGGAVRVRVGLPARRVGARRVGEVRVAGFGGRRGWWVAGGAAAVGGGGGGRRGGGAGRGVLWGGAGWVGAGRGCASGGRRWVRGRGGRRSRPRPSRPDRGSWATEPVGGGAQGAAGACAGSCRGR